MSRVKMIVLCLTAAIAVGIFAVIFTKPAVSIDLSGYTNEWTSAVWPEETNGNQIFAIFSVTNNTKRNLIFSRRCNLLERTPTGWKDAAGLTWFESGINLGHISPGEGFTLRTLIRNPRSRWKIALRYCYGLKPDPILSRLPGWLTKSLHWDSGWKIATSGAFEIPKGLRLKAQTSEVFQQVVFDCRPKQWP